VVSMHVATVSPCPILFHRKRTRNAPARTACADKAPDFSPVRGNRLPVHPRPGAALKTRSPRVRFANLNP